MTIQNNKPVTSATGNGITTIFTFNFKILSDDFLIVEKNGENQQGKYSVSINESGNGGNVIFNIAPAYGDKIVIYRNSDFSQDTSYKTSTGFQAKVVETSFDEVVAMTQELKRDIDRAPLLNMGSNISLKIADPIPNKALKISSDGTHIEYTEEDADEIINKAKQYSDSARESAQSALLSSNNATSSALSAHDSAVRAKRSEDAVAPVLDHLTQIDEVANAIYDVENVSAIKDETKAVGQNMSDVITVAENIDEIVSGAGYKKLVSGTDSEAQEYGEEHSAKSWATIASAFAEADEDETVREYLLKRGIDLGTFPDIPQPPAPTQKTITFRFKDLAQYPISVAQREILYRDLSEEDYNNFDLSSFSRAYIVNDELRSLYENNISFSVEKYISSGVYNIAGRVSWNDQPQGIQDNNMEVTFYFNEV